MGSNSDESSRGGELGSSERKSKKRGRKRAGSNRNTLGHARWLKYKFFQSPTPTHQSRDLFPILFFILLFIYLFIYIFVFFFLFLRGWDVTENERQQAAVRYEYSNESEKDKDEWRMHVFAAAIRQKVNERNDIKAASSRPVSYTSNRPRLS